MRIAVRTDGDSGLEAGMGHVVRSLAIAHRLKAHVPDLEIHFVMRDFKEGITKACDAGYPVTRLPHHPKQEDLEGAFSKIKPDLTLIDTLGSTPILMNAARASAGKVITFDDLEPSAGAADIIINGILWATRKLPPRVGKAKVYQGVEYVLLRPEFAEFNQRSKSISQRATRILLTTGGADFRGMSIPILRRLSESLTGEFYINAVIGSACDDKDSVSRVAARLGEKHYKVISDTPYIGKLMMESDLAIITGGTVLFECAACGLPAIVCSSYEHQDPAARWFGDKGFAVYLGDYSRAEEFLSEVVQKLINEQATRKRMSLIGRKLVDGRGLERIEKIIQSEIRL